jgi:hypothetical protein
MLEIPICLYVRDLHMIQALIWAGEVRLGDCIRTGELWWGGGKTYGEKIVSLKDIIHTYYNPPYGGYPGEGVVLFNTGAWKRNR